METINPDGSLKLTMVNGFGKAEVVFFDNTKETSYQSAREIGHSLFKAQDKLIIGVEVKEPLKEQVKLYKILVATDSNYMLISVSDESEELTIKNIKYHLDLGIEVILDEVIFPIIETNVEL